MQTIIFVGNIEQDCKVGCLN